MMRRSILCCLVLVGGLASCAGTPMPETFVDLDGREQSPLECAPGGAVVLIFISADCPIANGYAPQINALVASYDDTPVRFYLVHIDPDITREEARQHAADFGYTCPVLLDVQHDLVKKTGATITPEAAVFSADGELRYRGRINNWYGDIGRKRYKPTRHDLKDAVDAVLAGREPAIRFTDAVGCTIPPIE